MRAVEMDARRYAWCQGHGLWIMGMPVASFVEDIRGALVEGQDGLVRFACRQIGEACAVTLAVMLFNRRPIPPPSVRAAWALRCLGDHPLGVVCWELLRGDHSMPPDALVEKGLQLVKEVHELVGDLPDVLTPDGYFPALAVARDGLSLLSALGEDDFLPSDWKPIV
jgi:hypothetical protein